jgi:carbonic anhydrase
LSRGRDEPQRGQRSIIRARDVLWRSPQVVGAAVDHLRRGARILEELVRGDRLCLVGAEYSIESGKVDFMNER